MDKKFNSIPISQLLIGEVDGEKEAQAFGDNLEKYYFDFGNIYQKIANFDTNYYLVLGRKGTGKSLLGNYILEKKKKSFNTFCSIESYRDLKYQELNLLIDNDTPPNQYSTIWKFLMLLSIGKQILKDNSLVSHDKYSDLKRFIEDNFRLELNLNKVIETTKQNGINFAYKIFGFTASQTSVSGKFNYTEYIYDFEQTIYELLLNSKNEFSIILDDLDDRFRKDDSTRDSIISLIKVVDRLNFEFKKKGIKCKIIILLRSDIFAYLNDADLNKIKQTHSIYIDWTTEISPYSPLIKMLVNKIRNSHESFKEMNHWEIFKLFFPQKINKYFPEEFILARTFFRPRDLIVFLKKIIEKYPSTTYFGYKGFLEVEKDYAEYFFNELSNELKGYLDDDILFRARTLFAQFNQPKFTFQQLNEFYDRKKLQIGDIDLYKVLPILFDFGLLANYWDQSSKKIYKSKIRDAKDELDLDKDIIIHIGFRKYLLTHDDSDNPEYSFIKKFQNNTHL